MGRKGLSWMNIRTLTAGAVLVIILQAASPVMSEADLETTEARGHSGRQDEVQDELQDLGSRITQLEAEHGAYSSDLQPLFYRMGQLQQEKQDHLAALESFELALHNSKVNKGVHNEEQLPIVESMLESYSAINDWKNLGSRLHYMLWLHRRNYQESDDRLLSMIERVGKWYMRAYNLHSGGEALDYMVRADDLFDEILELLEGQHGELSPKAISTLQATATINYYIASDVSDVFKTSHREIREAMIPNKRATPYMNEVAVRDYYFHQSFYKGRRALQKIIDLRKQELPGSVNEYARALADQGDYYLSLNRKWNAMKNYRSAYESLLEFGADASEIDEIFGEPRPVEPFFAAGHDMEVPGENSYVDAFFEVPGNGWPRDIRITDTFPGDDKSLMTRGRHAVAATRYRPRFENGKPVSTSNVYLRYVFR